MRPEDFIAETPLAWDPETTTLTLQASTIGESLLGAADAAAARTAIGAGTSNLAIGTTASTAKAGNYQPTAANISDATEVGRNVLTAADAAAARTAIGAGTGSSNLALGTTSTTAKAGDYQPAAANISDSTAVGREVLTAADAATARSAIGAGTGTSNLTLGTTSSTAKAGDYQPSASDITDATAVGQSILTAADAAAGRTAIGAGTSSLTIGAGAGNAAAGNHTHSQYLAATQAAAVADSSGDAEAQLNALLASLRAAGILAE